MLLLWDITTQFERDTFTLLFGGDTLYLYSNQQEDL